jgi:hypothetical protein
MDSLSLSALHVGNCACQISSTTASKPPGRRRFRRWPQQMSLAMMASPGLFNPGPITGPQNAADSEEPVGTGSITAPPVAEPVAMLDVNKAIEASEAPAIKAVDAAVADVAESVTFAAAGQEATDCEGPMYTGPTTEPVAAKSRED